MKLEGLFPLQATLGLLRYKHDNLSKQQVEEFCDLLNIHLFDTSPFLFSDIQRNKKVDGKVRG